MAATNFHPICLDERADYVSCWQSTPVRTADSLFTNLWAWSEVYGLEWRVRHGLYWIRETGEDSVYWAPAGDWDAVCWQNIPELCAGTRLVRVPDALCDRLAAALPGRVRIEQTPGQWEYVYDARALATLKGNALHKKRNHLNAFLMRYGEDFRPLTPALIPSALSLAKEWLRLQRDAAAEALQAEHRAVDKVLRHWDALSLTGGALFVDDKMIAFCVGEALSDDMMVVHVEKALPAYRGAYQAVNAAFARTVGEAFTTINREQDGDDPGLRQAKRGYAPVDMLRKNTVIISG